MTANRHIRENMRLRCAKCGAPARWAEPCVLCGSGFTERSYVGKPLPAPRLRVAHGHVCTAEDEPHPCHCGGGVTHPCNCYEN